MLPLGDRKVSPSRLYIKITNLNLTPNNTCKVFKRAGGTLRDLTHGGDLAEAGTRARNVWQGPNPSPSLRNNK